MFISFTGHRDKYAKESDLDQVQKDFPGAIWVHGGAIGFDSQVHCRLINTDYQTYGKEAPLVRNMEIIKKGNILIALFDGRSFGGTFFTLKEAKKLGKEIRIITPY